MANIFTGAELVQIGIQIEKNGRDFYNTLEGQSNNKKAKDIFRYLAGEEEKHIKVFEKILSAYDSFEGAESYPGEFIAYMKSLAQNYVFTRKGKGLEVARQIKDEAEAIDKGIGFEKDSIVFYEGMKKAVIGANTGAVEQLIAQEQLHLQKLMELKASL